ncbi:hypothetical protein [Tessaracoccus flavus]|uniref:Uncharacterized protein n=1 Tax=Tessaracoccus flavus TaxID=1610493 RepID=A0A1Q2CID7_9ACTN|nr:hypothetical protein [Tessaracoccus flavus]AQP45820.1 hypothetical protein RPIT_14240 [Tessaracoccus flavus]SDZ14762.1 type II secretion system protein F (GspF) [Tessaracoccus flavus]
MIGLVVACGMVVGLGSVLVVRGALTAPVRLSDALAALDRRSVVIEAPPAGLEGFGERAQRRLKLPLSAAQQRLLFMQGRSVGDFFIEKLVWTVAGALLPLFWSMGQLILGNPPGLLPLGLGLALAGAGYFVADIRLRAGAEQERRAATDGIHTFFDLVVLERLANSSAAQATANAAAISDAPLFRRITAGLERARMEQTQPWDELHRIADEWNVPELADFADVMRLEEQGAALAEVLQARVKELRDAHLAHQRTAAQEATEGMALWMTLPALILGITFVTPALLTLVNS